MVGATSFFMYDLRMYEFTIYEFTMYDLCTIEMKFNHFTEYQGHKVIYDVRFGKIRTIGTIGPMNPISPIVTYNLAARLREGRQNHIHLQREIHE